VYACRAVVLALVIAGYLREEKVDAWVSESWSWVRETSLMQFDSFEPLLVITSFTVFLVGWSAVDLGRFGSRVHAWTARYRVQPSGPKGKTHEEHSRQIWRPEGHGLQEFSLYLLPLLVFDWLYPRRVLPAEAPTARGLVGEVFATLALYDALFAVSHRLMHGVPWLFRTIHAKHHRHSDVRAREIFRLSTAEEVADTACSVAAVNLTRAHPLSRAAYNVIIVYLLCEIHSGYDTPWSLANVVPWGLMMGTREHVEHHATGRGAYAKFFSMLEPNRYAGKTFFRWAGRVE
jgi:cholesterol 25-hydroxylase